MPFRVDVLVVGQLTSDEAAELAQEFALVGLAAELREVPPRRALEDIAWIMLAAVPLKPFLDQLVKDSAADAYKRLKSLVGRVFRQRQISSTEPAKVLLLQDSKTGIHIVLEPDLSDEAYTKLLTFDLSTIRRGPLHYDRFRNEWRSESDEADGAEPLS